MEVSNKQYKEMAKDYKKADKVYKEMKSHSCNKAAMNPNYDYKKGVQKGIMDPHCSFKKAK